MRKFERRWYNLGKEVTAAEKAGRDDRANRLVDQADQELEALSPAKRREASDAFLRGRYTRNPSTPRPSVAFSSIAYVEGRAPSVSAAERGEALATTLEVKFSISGKDLATMLGVQRKSLPSVLRDLTFSQATQALMTSASGAAILGSFKDDAKKHITDEINQQVEIPGMYRLTNFKIAWSPDTRHWEADVYPDDQAIAYDAEVNCVGDWRGRR